MRIFLLLALSILVLGCLDEGTTEQAADRLPYNVESVAGYDGSECLGTGYQTDGRVDVGVKVILRDSDTGENLSGHGTLTAGRSQQSLGDGQFTCEEGLAGNRSLISVYSAGHMPSVFELEFQPNTLVTLTVPLRKSCSGGRLQCIAANEAAMRFEGLSLSAAEDRRGELSARVSSEIRESFGLDPSEYSLTCLECDMGRGGFVKARGIYMNETRFELYRHWGWCSSGGGDCGWSACFASDGSLFERVRFDVCNGTSSYYRHMEGFCPDATYENSSEAKKQCMSGGFDYGPEGGRVLSVRQDSGRCGSKPQISSENCLRL